MLRQGGTSLLPATSVLLNGFGLESLSLVRWASAAAPNPAYADHLSDDETTATTTMKTFRASDISYQLILPSPPISLEGVKFGTVFTDHMFLAQHSDTSGWSTPEIKPFGTLQIHPAAQVLHYGMTCFEGMKAYKGQDGRARLFRPELNMQRLYRSSQRLMLADYDPNELLECIKQLVTVDKAWLPSQFGHSLYIRPFIYSSASVLGVARATNTAVSVILSPVGPYFPTGPKPITLFIEEDTPRAWQGGVGEFKVGGNYAPTILPQVRAARDYGTQQVVYVDKTFEAEHDPEMAYFDECGAMNVFFLLETKGGDLELATPPLDGTILPGVTRDSIISLAKQWGEFKVSERYVTIKEVKQAAKEGRLVEAFGSGTACVVQPIKAFLRSNGDVFETKRTGVDLESVTARLGRELLDIQYGRVKDHPWSMAIDD